MPEPIGEHNYSKDDPRTIRAWCMYDWANSAYMNTVVVVLLPVYFAGVVVGRDGVRWGSSVYTADTLWAMAAGLTALLAFVTAPILGAAADYSSNKKRALLAFAYTGAAATVVLSTSGAGEVVRTLIVFIVAHFCFVSANVFYDAFLPQIASAGQIDRVSARGYAYGYLGGGVQCALALGFLKFGAPAVGMSEARAVQIGLAAAAVWWGGFALIPARMLREPVYGSGESQERLSPFRYVAIGARRTWGTLKRIRKLRPLVLFLIAFMLYDDGIQTVILMASIYGSVELKLPSWALMATVLLIQFVAMGGALLFGRIATRLGTKRTVMLTLAIWSGVVIYAYFITTMTQFFALGMVVGLVMGGSQALSRSLYGSMVPEAASAEFFGFFTVFSRFSAVWGPLAFAVISHRMGSARLAILSIIVFFLAGLTLLFFVDEEKARAAKEQFEV